jgi:hypothetical protein
VPFTLSHPAAVLLLRGTRLPVTAMVAGSMAPDVPMFVPIPGSYGVTHSWVGVVTVDLLISVVAVGLWLGVMREALVDLAPAAVRDRLEPWAGYDARQWALVPLAAVLGSASHVLWDAFTHRARWGVREITWLHEVHGGLVGFKWAQYASGVLGLLVVGAWALTTLRRLAVQPRSPRVPELCTRALAAVLGATALVGAVAALSAASPGLVPMAFRAAVLGTITLAVGLVALAVCWQVLARRGLRTGTRSW